MSEISQI